MRIFVNAVVVLSVLMIVCGCSNDSKKRSSNNTGTAVFFHNIDNAPEFQLDAVDEKDRNGYGTVSFENFGGGILLKP